MSYGRTWDLDTEWYELVETATAAAGSDVAELSSHERNAYRTAGVVGCVVCGLLGVVDDMVSPDPSDLDSDWAHRGCRR